MTLVILALYGAYLSDWGPPAATREALRKLARARLVARYAKLGRCDSGNCFRSHRTRFDATAVAEPHAGYGTFSFDPAFSYPLATIIGALLSIAVIAAVTEEMAFRGYMQKTVGRGLRNFAGRVDRRIHVLGSASRPRHHDYTFTIFKCRPVLRSDISYISRSLLSQP